MTPTENDPLRAGSSEESVWAVCSPAAPPADVLERFWEAGAEFEAVEVNVRPPEQPLEILERLGASPFERARFPLIGFLATTYEKVSRYALDEH